MISPDKNSEKFSKTYPEARQKFFEAARLADAEVHSFMHPDRGQQGEDLATDVALIGNPNAEKLLVVTSGCHGVEGYAGSGIQGVVMRDPDLPRRLRQKDVALLCVHALNPFGFSHLRRVTEENIDLNRNCQDFSRQLPVNEEYRELHALLLPETWPPSQENELALAEYIQRHGVASVQRAITSGQYEFPDGLFYGGSKPTWSNVTFRKILNRFASAAESIAWIDLHSGLGPCGYGERIYTGLNSDDAKERAKRWWGNVTSAPDGSSVSASPDGLLGHLVYDVCKGRMAASITMEFGTRSIMELMHALRAETWCCFHPSAPLDLAQTAKQKIFDAFFVNTDDWKARISEQACEAIEQAIEGLAASRNPSTRKALHGYDR